MKSRDITGMQRDEKIRETPHDDNTRKAVEGSFPKKKSRSKTLDFRCFFLVSYYR
ncbi:hypothetical protein [Filifactor villosus]|uniref:Uncharacterized protein n=1 Tax=Filifactor villosus TaxID=29374 RepID=A0ABV9QK93_9FIRM